MQTERENQILNWIRKGLEQFEGELRGRQVVLFGSRAAGSARERSDFDIGVMSEQPLPGLLRMQPCRKK
jgi:predicted nucleotidyltransferase